MAAWATAAPRRLPARRRSWPLRATPVRRLTPCSIRRWPPKCGHLAIPGTGQVQTGQPQPNQFGPGGAKGGNQADFDSLIDLITSTISPTSWTDSGGTGSIAPFETNLTLVVSQTQEIHEQIADLLQQLRRLQDLQVTIEVRFITLNDNFFEQIGVNFNFNIPTQTANGVTAIGSKHIPSQVVGDLGGNAVPSTPPPNGTTANPAPPLEFRQGSFNAATVPAFAGIGTDSTSHDLRLRHPQRYRGLLPDSSLPRRHAQRTCCRRRR